MILIKRINDKYCLTVDGRLIDRQFDDYESANRTQKRIEYAYQLYNKPYEWEDKCLNI